MSSSSRRVAVVIAATTLLLLLPLLLAREAGAQRSPETATERARREQLDAKLRVRDSSHAQTLELRDGQTLLGRIVEVTDDSVRFQTSFAMMTIARSAIAGVRDVRSPTRGPGGELWPEDPNTTRLFFSPTGRMLQAGDSYFSDTYLLFLGWFRGVTDQVTLGAGMSILPSDDFVENNVFYVMPKIGLVQKPDLNVAAGALVGMAPVDHGTTFGITYGVATFGPPDASVTAGAGYAFAGGDWTNDPLLMLGLHKRLTRRTAFVSENYMIPNEQDALISYGVRVFGEKMGVDLAFWNVSGDDMIFPGVPYLAFVAHF